MQKAHACGCLSEDGLYEGIDVDAEALSWCSKYIAGRHRGFRFQVADVCSGEYNPRGKHRLSEYSFPYGITRFSLVILRSVFTNMLPGDIDSDIDEISHMLKSEKDSPHLFYPEREADACHGFKYVAG